jgi:alkanesulfonate monooxygenase SsuD/methylene tetrahydromethanopterin reductase-like flavin-dependent oxidoreductase (luciferase family)
LAAVRLGVSPFASTRAGFERVAAVAADGGLDTLWLGDGYLQSSDFPLWAGGLESTTAIAWLAGRFPSVGVGISAAVLPLRDPAWLAKQATTLDQLTAGRFTLAVCPGFWDRELEHRGIPVTERAERFEEALTRLRRALAAPPGDDQLAPPAHTPGGPPLWLAGGEPTMRRALRFGLPYQASRRTPDELAPLARRWFDGGGGLLAHRVRVEVGAAAGEGHAVDWHAVAGPPGFVAEQLQRYRELGVGDLSLVPGQDDEASLATVTALVQDVLPRLG